MLHWLSRSELLLGAEGLAKLADSKVAIFGIGGVGSYAAEALVRCGVGRFLLVDDDQICLTNLNRQIHATRQTVGKAKVEVMKQRMLEINPKADVQCAQQFYLPGQADQLLTSDLHYIIDAIDTVTAKLDLVVEAGQRNIPIISSMGTGNRLDPTRFRITDLSKTSGCPLARVMRKELRARGITSLKVVFSDEPAMTPQETDDNSCSSNCICPKGTQRVCTVRRQIPGSVSFVPAVAGMILASAVVRELAGV